MSVSESTEPPEAPPSPRPPTEPWWRRPWIGPLMLVAAVFLAVSVPRYLTFDPSLSRMEVPPGDAVYYPLLVVHVLCGTVAMAAGCFQIWPRFRAAHPWGHRTTGRVYVFAGVLPGGITALYVGVHTPFGPTVMAANLTLAVLWLTTTVIAFRMVRRRRFADHRLWMIRSFALTMSIVLSRILVPVVFVALLPSADALFGGDQDLHLNTATGIGVWLAVVLSLVFAEVGIHRGGGAARRVRSPVARSVR